MEQMQAQRRLVKSPPELWAELSDEATLGRHLAEFGEIRITRTDHESTVAWEGERASGTVQIEEAGWGTKVILSAAVASEARPQPAPTEVKAPVPVAAPRTPGPAAAAPKPDAAPRTPEPIAAARTPYTAVASRTPEPEPRPQPGASEPARRGVFARLFGARRRATAAPVKPAMRVTPPRPARPGAPAAEIPAPPAPAPDPSPPVPAPDPAPPTPDPAPPAPEPVPPGPPTEPDPTPTPQIRAAGPLGPNEIEQVLTAVLDDLGSAHHRPFSRG